jgi:hypothetical protein
MTTTLEKNPLIIDLLNGTYSSIKTTVPIHHVFSGFLNGAFKMV